MSDHVDATFYVQVEPQWNQWMSGDSPNRLQGAKAVTLTQAKPGRQRGGTVLVKLTVRLPKSAFLPLAPEAIVVVPEDRTLAEPIQVTVGDVADE